MARVPVDPALTVMLFEYDPLLSLDEIVALLLPVESPRIMPPRPKAVVKEFEVALTVPLLIVRSPVKVLFWLKMAVPVKAVPPDSPRVNPPAPLPHAPVWAKFPLPVSVAVLAPLVTAPKLNTATPVPGLTILNFVFPVRVVAPKTTPAVPEFTLPPPSTVRVFAPIDNVPKV